MSKKVRTLSSISAAILSVAMALNTAALVSADDFYTEVNGLAGIEFASFEKMCGFMQSTENVSSIDDKEEEVSAYLLSADGVYVPCGISADDIYSIIVTPTYAETSFIHNDIKMHLRYYHSAIAGKAKYAEAEEKSLRNTDSIKYYFLLEESYYVWKQEGDYFMLRIDGENDKYISLCNAEKLAFSESSSGAELTKINGKLYLVDPDGGYAVGWQTINGEKYYFRKNGEAAVKNCVIDGVRYKFSSEGVCLGKYSGWVKKGGSRYYYKNGIMKKNCWIKSKGKRTYFLQKDGKTAVGKVTISGIEYEFDENGKLLSDQWGLTITAQDVTPSGLKLEFLWDGTKTTGELSFGSHYTLEQYKNGEWADVPFKGGVGTVAFTDEAYSLEANKPVYQKKSLEYIYGRLGKGKYRLCTPVMDFRSPGDYNTKIYYAYFTIE